MLDYALQYAGRGWKVFPLHTMVEGPTGLRCSCGKNCDSPGKHPRIKNGFLKATSDPTQINIWWKKWPDANIGIATGESGLTVLDPDGPDGAVFLQRLVAENQPLPVTLTAKTGNGFHIYFQGVGVKSFSGGRDKIPLHVRGEGGYVVAPPSKHASGRIYEWIEQDALASLPDWVREWRNALGGVRETGSALVEGLGPLPAHLANGGRLADSAAVAARAMAVLVTPWSAHEESRVRSALAAIPADAYETWFQVGMALHWLEWERSDGTSVGFDLWDSWSQTCPDKYASYGMAEKWRSFGRAGRGGITLGTLFHIASEAGWRPDLQRGDTSDLRAPAMNGHAMPGPVAGMFGPASSAPGSGPITGFTPVMFPDVDKLGNPRATVMNVRHAMRLLGLDCAHDTFHDKLIVGGHVIEQWAGEFSDNATQGLRAIVRRVYGFDGGTQNVHDAVVQECIENSFDPVQDYLDDLTWDGVPRLATWLHRYLGAEASHLNGEIGRLALIAAVRRVRQPGSKFDQIVVLEGVEGTGKSTAIQIMAGLQNFSDQTVLTLDDKGQQEAVQGVWLYEIADLAGMHRADVEKVKAFASRTYDRARPAYGRNRVDRPRRCIFFATTNNETYLKSQTGNRRFWPVVTGRLDLEALRIDRDQLWAEAVRLEAGGASIVLGAQHWGAATALQDARRDHDPWEDILEHLKGKVFDRIDGGQEERVTSRDVFEQHLRMSSERVNDVAAKRLAFCLKRLGWEGPKRIRDGAHVVRGYTREV